MWSALRPDTLKRAVLERVRISSLFHWPALVQGSSTTSLSFLSVQDFILGHNFVPSHSFDLYYLLSDGSRYYDPFISHSFYHHLSLLLSYTLPLNTTTIHLILLHPYSAPHQSIHPAIGRKPNHLHTLPHHITACNGRFIPYSPYPSNAITILLLQPRPSRREQPPARSLHTPPIRTVHLPATQHVLPEAHISKLPHVLPSDRLRQPDDDSRCIASANVPEAGHLDPTSGLALPSPH